MKADWQPTVDAESLRASGLSPQEFSTLSSYMVRREQLTVEARMRVLPKLLSGIMARQGKNPGDFGLAELEAYTEGLLDPHGKMPEGGP